MKTFARKIQEALRETREEITTDWPHILLLSIIVYVARYWLAIVFIVVGVSSSLEAQPSAVVGEEILHYKVKWGFFRLGSLTVRRQLIPGSSGTFRSVLKAESDVSIPFINVYFVNTAILRTQSLSSVEFTSVIGRDAHTHSHHFTDSLGQRLFMEEYAGHVRVHSDSVELREPVYDDPGMFEFFRRFAGSGVSQTVASVMERRIEQTAFTFPTETESIEVSAFNEARTAYRFTGKGTWIRSDYAGLKGEFCGWVTADSARIPLRIEAKIFLGSVVLELESCGPVKQENERTTAALLSESQKEKAR